MIESCVVLFYSVIRSLIIMMQSTCGFQGMQGKLHERSFYFTNGKKTLFFNK